MSFNKHSANVWKQDRLKKQSMFILDKVKSKTDTLIKEPLMVFDYSEK